MAYALIDWDAISGSFTAKLSNGRTLYAQQAEAIVAYAREAEQNLQVNEHMKAEKLVEVMAAAIFARVPLKNMKGKEITETPVPDATVSYVTREQVGALLPDGWFVEHQLNKYAACWGEEMTFPARRTLRDAIADIHYFLAQSAKSASDDLLASMEKQAELGEMTQASMWLSSDRP